MDILIQELNTSDFPLCYANSSLTHLVAALFLSPDSPMAMFSFYADASGRDETDYLTVAAFVASADEWLRFNKDWAAVLGEYGVQYLRMSEFALSQGQFLGWEEPKRRDFLTEAEKVIASYARWVSAFLVIADYKKVDAEYQLHESFYPFPLCGFQCVQMIQRWRDAHHLMDSSFEYIFDRGDQHRGQLSKAVDNLVGVEPIFRNKLKFPPLQAADYAAYEVYKAYKQIRLETDKLFEKFRESFGLLVNIHHDWGDFSEQSLRIFCRLQEIPRR